MRKRLILMLLIAMVFPMLISCDSDFYRGKRPIDYPDSSWECVGENYKISFKVGSPEEHKIVIDEDQPIVFEFLWSSIDSKVSVYEYGHSGDMDYYLFGGECTFGKKTFEIKINSAAEKWSIFSDVLVFDRIYKNITDKE